MVFPKKSTKKTQPTKQTKKLKMHSKPKATKHVLKIENLVSLISKELP